MNHFAQLALLEKSAYASAPPTGYDYSVNAKSGLRDPYAAYRPQAGTSAALREKGPGWGVIENGWGDFAASSIPVVGSAYLGNKAVQDFRRGNWGSGIGNTIWAGLGLIPGVGAAKGLVSGASKGFGAAMRGAAKGAFKGSASSGMAMLAPVSLAGIAMAAPMLDPVRPDPTNLNAYNTPTTGPAGDLQRTMVSAVVNNGVPPATGA